MRLCIPILQRLLASLKSRVAYSRIGRIAYENLPLFSINRGRKFDPFGVIFSNQNSCVLMYFSGTRSNKCLHTSEQK